MKTLSVPSSHTGYSCISTNVTSVYESVETWSFAVTTPNRKTNGDFNVILVDLYVKPGFPPHGWEATKADTTNESSCCSLGGLTILAGTNTLDDVDGVSYLPKSVCALLRVLGYSVDDSYLASPL